MDFPHSPFQKATTLWTVGGVYKAQASPGSLPMSSVSVVSYAFMSAVVGYCTKKGLDYLFEKFKKKKK